MRICYGEYSIVVLNWNALTTPMVYLKGSETLTAYPF